MSVSASKEARPVAPRAEAAGAASNPCQERLDRLEWVMGDVYRVHGVVVEVRSTSARFGRWMDRTLEAHRGRGAPEAQFSAAVGDEGPSSSSIHTLYRGIVPIVRSRRPSTLGRTLLHELEAFSYPKRDDSLFLYATAVQIDGRTALIPSYLAPYLSRSRRLIEAKGIRMSSGPAVAVDPGTGWLRPPVTRLGLPNGAAGRLAAGERPGSEVVEVRRRTPVDAVCWFARDMDEPVREVSRARSLYTLALETANLERLEGAALTGLEKLVGGARCFELRGDTPRSMLTSLVDATLGESNEQG